MSICASALGRDEVGDVVAVIAVLGNRLSERQRPNRLGEPDHLAAVVVDVVLARHVLAAEPEHPRDRVAVGGLPGVSDVERPGRVRRHELDVDRAAPPRCRAP